MAFGVALAVAAGAALFLLTRAARPEAPVAATHAPASSMSRGGAAPAARAAAGRAAPAAMSVPTPRLRGASALEIALGVERELALELERALVTPDTAAREAALAFALPELLNLHSGAVVAIIAGRAPDEARDALRDETARQWIVSDRDAAVEWMKSLPDADRAAAATVAMRRLAAASPAEAVRVADALGVGRDDGSVDQIVRIWSLSEPEAARRWLAAQGGGAAEAR